MKDGPINGGVWGCRLTFYEWSGLKQGWQRDGDGRPIEQCGGGGPPGKTRSTTAPPPSFARYRCAGPDLLPIRPVDCTPAHGCRLAWMLTSSRRRGRRRKAADFGRRNAQRAVLVLHDSSPSYRQFSLTTAVHPPLQAQDACAAQCSLDSAIKHSDKNEASWRRAHLTTTSQRRARKLQLLRRLPAPSAFLFFRRSFALSLSDLNRCPGSPWRKLP